MATVCAYQTSPAPGEPSQVSQFARPCERAGRRAHWGNGLRPLDFAPGGQHEREAGGPSRGGAGMRPEWARSGQHARAELRVAEKAWFPRPENKKPDPLCGRLFPSPITLLTVARPFSDPETQVPHAPGRLWPAAKLADVWPWCLPIASKGVF